jgi:hypothetical protein
VLCTTAGTLPPQAATPTTRHRQRPPQTAIKTSNSTSCSDVPPRASLACTAARACGISPPSLLPCAAADPSVPCLLKRQHQRPDTGRGRRKPPSRPQTQPHLAMHSTVRAVYLRRLCYHAQLLIRVLLDVLCCAWPDEVEFNNLGDNDIYRWYLASSSGNTNDPTPAEAAANRHVYLRRLCYHAQLLIRVLLDVLCCAWPDEVEFEVLPRRQRHLPLVPCLLKRQHQRPDTGRGRRKPPSRPQTQPHLAMHSTAHEVEFEVLMAVCGGLCRCRVVGVAA